MYKVPIHYTLQYKVTVVYNGKYVHSLHLYIHTPYLYLHLKYITVQLYLRTVYILGEQYTVHTRLTVHIITCSLFTLTLLTAALPQYYVTAGGCLSVYEVVYPSPRLSGCREGKEEREERRGEVFLGGN